ncbi:MAG: DUF2314 domain-containing protein [Planctomycetaceae bacterium]
MRLAVEEAQRRWPEFVERFERRAAGEHFAVKVPITRGENTEFIWLEVTAIEGDSIYGELANEPHDLGGLSLGDRVTSGLTDLNDWMFVPVNGETIGGFTLAAINQTVRRRQSRVEQADDADD